MQRAPREGGPTSLGGPAVLLDERVGGTQVQGPQQGSQVGAVHLALGAHVVDLKVLAGHWREGATRVEMSHRPQHPQSGYNDSLRDVKPAVCLSVRIKPASLFSYIRDIKHRVRSSLIRNRKRSDLLNGD